MTYIIKTRCIPGAALQVYRVAVPQRRVGSVYKIDGGELKVKREGEMKWA